jgi:hypothetical protein
MSVVVTRKFKIPIFGKALSDYAIGESVFLNVNGAAREFLIVNQGNPDSVLYDSSCNGTWLLMKDLYTTKTFDSTNNDYANSDIHAHLNSTFFGMFDSNIQSAIKEVRIPYQNGTGSGGSVSSGRMGLTTRIFLLSIIEVGAGKYVPNPADGAKLDFFNGVDSSASGSNQKIVAYYNGTASHWWLRSPNTLSETSVKVVANDGNLFGSYDYNYSIGVRPAVIFPSETKFDSYTNEFMG